VAQAAAQDRLDVRLGGAVGVVVGTGPLGAAGAAPAAPQRPALEEGWGPGEGVAAVTVTGGIDAAQADVGLELGGRG